MSETNDLNSDSRNLKLAAKIVQLPSTMHANNKGRFAEQRFDP